MKLINKIMTNHSVVLEEVNDLFWIADEKARIVSQSLVIENAHFLER